MKYEPKIIFQWKEGQQPGMCYWERWGTDEIDVKKPWHL